MTKSNFPLSCFLFFLSNVVHRKEIVYTEKGYEDSSCHIRLKRYMIPQSYPDRHWNSGCWRYSDHLIATWISRDLDMLRHIAYIAWTAFWIMWAAWVSRIELYWSICTCDACEYNKRLFFFSHGVLYLSLLMCVEIIYFTKYPNFVQLWSKLKFSSKVYNNNLEHESCKVGSPIS